MPQPLTTRQRQVYDFIAAEIRDKKVAPSLEEIARALGLRAISTVYKHITALHRKRYVFRDKWMSRSIVLVVESDCCPTCGRSMPTAVDTV